MKAVTLNEKLRYDGTQIAPLWAFEYSGVRGDSIVAFEGPMNVTHVIDAEDDLNGAKIAGDRLLHFIVEVFDSPATMRQAYYMQRLLIVNLKDQLFDAGIIVCRSGDDLFVDGGKLTVSIATCGISSEKIHCGVNLTTAGIPPEVLAASLEIENPLTFAKLVSDRFVDELLDIDRDIEKTRDLFYR